MRTTNISRAVENIVEVVRRRAQNDAVKAQQIVEYVVAEFTDQAKSCGYPRIRFTMTDLQTHIPLIEHNDMRLAARLLKKMGFAASYCPDTDRLKISIPRHLLKEDDPRY